MKKLFTLALALMAYAGVATAATVDDIKVCQHSYVLVFDDLTANGTRSAKGDNPIPNGTLVGDGYFMLAGTDKNHSVANNKGSVDLSDETFLDGKYTKYAEYGKHLNSFRLKKAQDMIALKVTGGSKVIVLGQVHSSRGAKIGPKADMTNEYTKITNSAVLEYTAPDDQLIYIGSEGGDYYISYLIVEANEAPGTPSIKVGDQTFEGGLWFREVTAKANDMVEEGSTETIPTVLTYTTDGSTPTAASPKYTNPIKVYENKTIKFQAFMDILGTGEITDDDICNGADYDVPVNFIFDAPTIEANGATFTITSPYAEQNGKNYYKIANGEEVQGDGTTLTESATVTAYTKITNGTYGTFTTNSAYKDVYALNPIKEKKTIAVTGGDVVVDEEATKSSTTGTVYTVENGTISADKADFFVKNLSWGVVKDAQYQVPAGEERYIKMSDTNISFAVAEDDVVNVKVTCSKNACKNIDAADAEDNQDTPDVDESKEPVNDRKCYVNVSGTNYGGEDLKLNPDGNVIEFELTGAAGGSVFTFQKYSGTGNILISSIEISYVGVTAISDVKAATKAENAVMYNIAGQKVSDGFKGLVIKNGKKVVLK